MSSEAKNVIITLLYDDDSTRTVTFEDVGEVYSGDIKGKILAINANANNEYENFYKTFVSNDGDAIIKIESCKVVEIEEEVVYSV